MPKFSPLTQMTVAVFFGDEIGVCPICGKKVVRGRYSYGCVGFKDGCSFRINFRILETNINKKQAGKILQEGFSDVLKFKSKSGKDFESKLKLEKDGKIVFDFTSNK